jgi:hypothetical protein
MIPFVVVVVPRTNSVFSGSGGNWRKSLSLIAFGLAYFHNRSMSTTPAAKNTPASFSTPPPSAEPEAFAEQITQPNRFKTDDAAMIVHSFSTENKWFDAYTEFLNLFGLSAKPGEMVSKQLPSGRPLRFGWAKGDPRFLLA